MPVPVASRSMAKGTEGKASTQTRQAGSQQAAGSNLRATTMGEKGLHLGGYEALYVGARIKYVHVYVVTSWSGQSGHDDVWAVGRDGPSLVKFRLWAGAMICVSHVLHGLAVTLFPVLHETGLPPAGAHLCILIHA